MSAGDDEGGGHRTVPIPALPRYEETLLFKLQSAVDQHTFSTVLDKLADVCRYKFCRMDWNDPKQRAVAYKLEHLETQLRNLSILSYAL